MSSHAFSDKKYGKKLENNQKEYKEPIEKAQYKEKIPYNKPNPLNLP